MKNLIVITCLFLSTELLAAVYRAPFETVNQKAYLLELNTEYFQSTAHVDYQGVETPMAEGESFTRLQSELLARYGLGPRLELTLGGRYRQNSYTAADNSLSSSGLESYFVAGKYSLRPIGGWMFATSAKFRKTAYTNELYTVGSVPADQMALGDSGTEMSFSGIVGRKLSSKHTLSLEFGYRDPASELSQELFYRIESGWVFGPTWGAHLGIDGVYSMGGDAYGDNPTGKPILDNSGSKMYNSINREWISPFINVDYAYDKNWHLSLGGSTILSGVSTDKGNTLLVSISYDSIGVSSEAKKIDSFKEYQIEASVIAVSPRGKFIKIDKGSGDDISKGMRFDIYQTDYFGGNKLVAAGIVFQVSGNYSIVNLTKIYEEKIKIKEGFLARGTDDIVE